MAIEVFPIPVTSTGPNSFSSTITSANLQYKAINPLSAGIYTITTSSTGSQATINFYDSTGVPFATGVTASGTLTFNLASAATGYYIQTDTGSNIIVSLSLTGNSVTGTQLSGTLDTITASGTYNQTGLLYVLACAGGGGGSGTNISGLAGGAGGSIASGFFVANTATTVTIGAAGNGGNANTAGNSGGQTSFGALLIAPFAGGASAGSGGNGQQGGLGVVVSGSLANGTNAGGTAGKYVSNGANTPGRVGGFGTGGTGGDGGSGNCTPGGAASGYGAGGGGAGGGNAPQAGGAGTAGVVYVLRGFQCILYSITMGEV